MTICTCSAQLQPHDPVEAVCPKPINWDLLCDDCGRDDGTHDYEVEH